MTAPVGWPLSSLRRQADVRASAAHYYANKMTGDATNTATDSGGSRGGAARVGPKDGCFYDQCYLVVGRCAVVAFT